MVLARRFRLAFLSGVFAKQVLAGGNASGPAFIAYAVNTESGNRYEHDLAVATVGELSNLGASLVAATATVLLFRLASFWLVLAVGTLASVYLSIRVEEMPRVPPLEEETL